MKDEKKIKKADALINRLMYFASTSAPFSMKSVAREVNMDQYVVSSFIKKNMIKKSPKVYSYPTNFSFEAAQKSIIELYEASASKRKAARVSKRHESTPEPQYKSGVPLGKGNTRTSETRLPVDYSPATEVVSAAKQEAAQAVAANTFVDKELDKADITIRVSRKTKHATEAYEFTIGKKNMNYDALINSLTSQFRS